MSPIGVRTNQRVFFFILTLFTIVPAYSQPWDCVKDFKNQGDDWGYQQCMRDQQRAKIQPTTNNTNQNTGNKSWEPVPVPKAEPRQLPPVQQGSGQQNLNTPTPQVSSNSTIYNSQNSQTVSSSTITTTSSSTIFSPPSVMHDIESFIRNNETISLFIVYLILVWFLSAARRNPSLAIFIVNILFITIGFPFWVLGRLLGMRSAIKGNYNSSRTKSSDQSSESSITGVTAPLKEDIIIQSQRSGGAWFDVGGVPAGWTDHSISVALNRASEQAISASGKSASGWVGRVRAVGRKSGRLYGIQ